MKSVFSVFRYAHHNDRASLCGFSLSVALACATVPQETLAVAGNEVGVWHNRIAVYLWMAGLDGTSGNRLEVGDIEASFSDIMKNLQGGVMLDYRGKKDKWGVGLDLIYLNINANPSISGPNPAPVGPPVVPADGDVDVKQWIVYGGYRHMKIDYEANNRAKFFYDMAVGGPVLGAGFSF